MTTFREKDIELLHKLLDDHAHEMQDNERESAEDMLDKMESGLGEATDLRLTEKQRDFAKSLYTKYAPDYQNLISSGKAPRGKEVPTIEMLKRENLPLKPPSRRKLDE